MKKREGLFSVNSFGGIFHSVGKMPELEHKPQWWGMYNLTKLYKKFEVKLCLHIFVSYFYHDKIKKNFNLESFSVELL